MAKMRPRAGALVILGVVVCWMCLGPFLGVDWEATHEPLATVDEDIASHLLVGNDLGGGQSKKKHTTVSEEEEAGGVCNSLLRHSWRGITGTAAAGVAPAPAHIWCHLQSDIVKKTSQTEFQHAPVNDMTKELEQWGEWLFALSHPQRMKRALHSFVLRKSLESLHETLDKRTRNEAEEMRPLRTLVMGGSVPAGTGCAKAPFDFLPQNDGPRVRAACVWPSRLNLLMNSLLGGGGRNVVQIDNMALGGATSDVGALVVQCHLWSNDPDVVIASFAANDCMLNNPAAAVSNMKKLVQAVNNQRNCTTQLPLLVYFDEFFGWPSTSVQDHLNLHASLTQLAEWNEFLLLSYVDVFSDLVMANISHDTVFKGKWHPRPDPHGGRSFHITATWVICYCFLQIAFDYCAQPTPTASLNIPTMNTNYSYSVATPPRGPRPPIEDKLQFDQVGELWQQNANKCLNNKGRLPCDFLWIANRLGQNAARFPGQISDFLGPKLLNNTGWREGGDYNKNKHGWEAFEPGSAFTLSWILTENVTSITILSMQSYGKKWANSKLQMVVNHASSFEWHGYHEQETSVSVPFTFPLNETLSKGDSIHVEFNLIGGSTFKISGMMFCAD